MAAKEAGYLYIAATVALTVYAQLALKWRLRGLGGLPDEIGAKLRALVPLLLDPVVLSSVAATLLASLAWAAALTHLDLGHAYSFMSLTFVAVLLLSGWFLGERISAAMVLGVTLIVVGTVIAANG